MYDLGDNTVVRDWNDIEWQCKVGDLHCTVHVEYWWVKHKEGKKMYMTYMYVYDFV